MYSPTNFGKAESTSQVYKISIVLTIIIILVITGMIPSKSVVYLSFLMIPMIILNFSDTDLIKSTILLFVLNGIMRRVASSDIGYFSSNDVLILLPYFPILVLLVKNHQELRVPGILKFSLSFVFVFALVNIQNAPSNIVWGMSNIFLAIIFGQISKKYIDTNLLKFVGNLGVVVSVYIFYQKIALPYFDLGWCLSRKSNLVILESCFGSSLRLWGTMESAVNMACFLAVCFFINTFQSNDSTSRIFKVFRLCILFVAIFLTGTRTFIFVLPIIYIISAYKFRKISVPRAIGGSVFVVFTAGLLPTLATFFDYQERWINRLNIRNLAGDESLQERFSLLDSFYSQVTLKNFLIGDGIGLKSRGLNAIDSGFLSLVLEIGLPLALLFVFFIANRLTQIQNLEDPVLIQCWSVCTLLFVSNFSFVVFTGSSSIFFWFVFFKLYSGNKFERTF
jgi:hypothetical protein